MMHSTQDCGGSESNCLCSCVDCQHDRHTRVSAWSYEHFCRCHEGEGACCDECAALGERDRYKAALEKILAMDPYAENLQAVAKKALFGEEAPREVK